MKLQTLKISHFRNLTNLSITADPSFNFISGSNGAGKTSVLEAIYCLGTARSFRTTRNNLLIQNGFDKLNLFATFCDRLGKDHQVGLEKGNGSKRFRLDKSEVQRASEIARLFPLQTFTPDSHALLDTGPLARRRFLDWGLFHVEPDYLAVWQKYRKILSQRNAALRNNQSRQSITVWNEPLASVGEQISNFRQQYCDQISSHLDACLELFQLPYALNLEYRPGWSKNITLAQALENKIEFDLARAVTTSGPHRAELSLTIEKHPASSFLSRGESKAVAFSLQFCQMKLCALLSGEMPVVIWDDVDAEFDEVRRSAFLQLLADMDCQTFLTTTNFAGAVPNCVSSYKWFHVERGDLKEMV